MVSDRLESRQHHAILEEGSDSDEPQGGKKKYVASCPSGNDSFNIFAKLAKAIKVASDVGRDLDDDFANLINMLFENPPSVEDLKKMKESI